MNKTKNVGQQQLTWEQPHPIREQVQRYPVKDGVSVPSSVTEDIGGFSIAPWYFSKQLRKINRLQIRRQSDGVKSDLTRKISRLSRRLTEYWSFS